MLLVSEQIKGGKQSQEHHGGPGTVACGVASGSLGSRYRKINAGGQGGARLKY